MYIYPPQNVKLLYDCICSMHVQYTVPGMYVFDLLISSSPCSVICDYIPYRNSPIIRYTEARNKIIQNKGTQLNRKTDQRRPLPPNHSRMNTHHPAQAQEKQRTPNFTPHMMELILICTVSMFTDRNSTTNWNFVIDLSCGHASVDSRPRVHTHPPCIDDGAPFGGLTRDLEA
jgi:hypothetical protein